MGSAGVKIASTVLLEKWRRPPSGQRNYQPKKVLRIGLAPLLWKKKSTDMMAAACQKLVCGAARR
jgi:hypothetical protein